MGQPGVGLMEKRGRACCVLEEVGAGAAVLVGTSIHCLNGLRSLMDLEVPPPPPLLLLPLPLLPLLLLLLLLLLLGPCVVPLLDQEGLSVATSLVVVLSGVTTYTCDNKHAVRPA